MFQELKDSFNKGEISRIEYTAKMYEYHEKLHEYADFISGTDVESIVISDRKLIVNTKKYGLKLVCQKDDTAAIPHSIINIGEYEMDDSELIHSLVRDGDTFIDVGANIGWYSIGIPKVKNNVKMYSFEPMPKTYKQFMENIKLNDMEDKINTYHYGLSNKDGEVEFYYFPNNSGNSSMAKMNDGISEKMVLKVEMLDTFIKNNKIDKVDFLKCDVEGAELLVFEGGIETIKKDKPIIFAEMLRKWSAKYDYHPNVIIKMFEEIGYQCYVLVDGKLKKFFSMDEDTIETNFLFIHADSWANIKDIFL